MNDTPHNARMIAFHKLAIWSKQEPHERDNMLLLEARPAAWIGGLLAVSLQEQADGPVLRLGLAKPRGEGDTYRDLDVEGFSLVMGLSLCGGSRLVLEEKGEGGGFYYPRLYIGGHTTSGQLRRPYLMPILADTPLGKHTVEPVDHHGLLRRDLGIHRDHTESERTARYGAEEAKAFAIARWREIAKATPHLLPPGVGEDDYSGLLEALHARLKAVPLGRALEV